MLDQLNSHGQLRVSVQVWRVKESERGVVDWQAWFESGPRVAVHSNDAFLKGFDAQVH